MAKTTRFEFVDQIGFGRILVILWRFSLFTKFQIIVVLVVKWKVWAISGKITIKLPKIAQIQFDQRIQIWLTLQFPKMIYFLKFGQFWVIRLLNKGTELVGYSRVPPIFEKFSEQVANGPRVVPWPVVYENVLISQILLKLKRRRAPQFYEAILLNKLWKYLKIDFFWPYLFFKCFQSEICLNCNQKVHTVQILG